MPISTKELQKLVATRRSVAKWVDKICERIKSEHLELLEEQKNSFLDDQELHEEVEGLRGAIEGLVAKNEILEQEIYFLLVCLAVTCLVGLGILIVAFCL